MLEAANDLRRGQASGSGLPADDAHLTLAVRRVARACGRRRTLIEMLHETLSAVRAHDGTLREAALMHAAAGLEVFPASRAASSR